MYANLEQAVARKLIFRYHAKYQMKKVIVISVGILIALVIGVYLFFADKEYVVRIPESEIQARLEEKLPMTKSYLLFIRVTLKNPRVQLKNGSNRVHAGLDVLFDFRIDNKSSKPLGGSIDVSGGILYAADERNFFLTDPVVENLSVSGIAPEHTAKVNKALTNALGAFYKVNPIYRLRSVKGLAAKTVLKNVVVENKELVITLGF